MGTKGILWAVSFGINWQPLASMGKKVIARKGEREGEREGARSNATVLISSQLARAIKNYRAAAID